MAQNPVVRHSDRTRHPQDFYPTEPALCQAIVRRYLTPWIAAHARHHHPLRVLDVGAGDGPWGQALKAVVPAGIWLTGVEVRAEATPCPVYDEWVTADYIQWARAQPRESWDLILGNPPFRLNNLILAESIQTHPDGPPGLLHPLGKLVFLLPLAYSTTKARCRGLFYWHPMERVDVLVTRPSFLGNGSRATGTDEYAIFQWGGTCRPGDEWRCRPFDWVRENELAWSPGHTLPLGI